jgi:TonB family protein
MSDQQKKKQFIKLPRYLGSKESFRDFVARNLKYPPEALRNKIEGTVHLSYMVDDKGNVNDITIEHGLGHGCDEEAIRLVRLMKFAPVKNRGVRVSSRQKTRIQFKLPRTGISYTLKTKEENPPEKTENENSYSYSITIKKT